MKLNHALHRSGDTLVTTVITVVVVGCGALAWEWHSAHAAARHHHGGGSSHHHHHHTKTVGSAPDT
jgi:hypothetical protein